MVGQRLCDDTQRLFPALPARSTSVDPTCSDRSFRAVGETSRPTWLQPVRRTNGPTRQHRGTSRRQVRRGRALFQRSASSRSTMIACSAARLGCGMAARPGDLERPTTESGPRPGRRALTHASPGQHQPILEPNRVREGAVQKRLTQPRHRSPGHARRHAADRERLGRGVHPPCRWTSAALPISPRTPPGVVVAVVAAFCSGVHVLQSWPPRPRRPSSTVTKATSTSCTDVPSSSGSVPATASVSGLGEVESPG
ncbi:hypothetical protein EDD33_2333 [Nocardioides aurantiacus]|uniref:Uncharacterized protein n=1 Tax=Nocardioides aurantiacus TaxID=86796 RepID=A0A3N2CVH5_9ACTN|nr:hypothetical protein EDD33_2333 [Nocardioides aurantiacus]